MKYFKYLRYLLKHIYYVRQECWKRGLYWRGLVHDLSKFLPSEFVPYSNFFYGKSAKPIRDKTGYYKPTDTGDKAFDFAWLLHQKRNRHHWQWWILPEDEGGVKVLNIPEPFLTEMICDWIGAGKAQGHFSPPEDSMLETKKWWIANNHKMQLHVNTKRNIEYKLGLRTSEQMGAEEFTGMYTEIDYSKLLTTP